MITESKHRRAVKEPWCQSNQNEALGQILVTNQHLDQLAAAHVDFASWGMLDGTCLSFVLQQQLGVYNPSSHSFDNHFDTGINLAAGAIHAPDPASVNETETISDTDQSIEKTSTEDEDPNEEVVNDLDVFAEVKLPSTIH